MVDLDNDIALPFDQLEPTFDKYVQKIMKSREAQRMDKENLKIAIDQFSYDYWYAQNFKIDITKMPQNRPFHMNDDHKRKYFEYLRKHYKKEKKEDNNDLSPKENLFKNDTFKPSNNFTEADNNDFAQIEKEIK